MPNPITQTTLTLPISEQDSPGAGDDWDNNTDPTKSAATKIETAISRVNQVVVQLGANPAGVGTSVENRLDTLDTTVAAKETPTGAQAKVTTHEADTTAIHGFADTTDVALKSGVAQVFTGENTFKAVNIAGTAGAGFLNLLAQSTAPPGLTGSGRLYSVTENGFTRVSHINELTTPLVMGRDATFVVRNMTGVTLTKGQTVYVNGSTGNIPHVALAKADATTTLPSLGIVLENIANNGFGYVMVSGIITGINTSAYTSGDVLYVSSSVAGGLQNTRPVSPLFANRVGTVLVSGVGNGSIEVKVAPFVGGMETGTNAATWTAAGGVVVGGANSLTGDISPTQITANQNDYNPTGLSTASTLRLSTDASRNITGLQGGSDGRLLLIHNIGAFNIVLADESASSVAGYRFALNAEVTILPDNLVILQYDSTSSRWRCLAGGIPSDYDGGAFLDPAGTAAFDYDGGTF